MDIYDIEAVIRRNGKYLSYAEFIKANPDLELFVNSNDFYRILKGDTKEKNKKELKRAYLDEPTRKMEQDWEERVSRAKKVIQIEINDEE